MLQNFEKRRLEALENTEGGRLKTLILKGFSGFRKNSQYFPTAASAVKLNRKN